MVEKVVWTHPAREDLVSHLKYLAEKSPRAASKLYEEIEAVGYSLNDCPRKDGRSLNYEKASTAELSPR